MRLINTVTLEQKEFFDPPPYAILSHRWGDEEVSYEDYALLHDRALKPMRELLRNRTYQIKGRSGYKKIYECCQKANGLGYKWVWIDTCCIDKRSSAELSEAINSMFKWYKDSKICIVHLADVPPLSVGIEKVKAAFRVTSWFTRCWTLQELIAPQEVAFCTRAWDIIHHLRKSNFAEPSMQIDAAQLEWARRLANITSIPSKLLLGGVIDFYSAAEKMSWAAQRRATREEDVAYSLLGLFGINMPMLYGEGSKAFTRLQKEIIQHSIDESILAWRMPQGNSGGKRFAVPYLSFLAPSPLFFAGCGNIRQSPELNHWVSVPNTITSCGLQVQVSLPQGRTGVRIFRHKRDKRICFVKLNCQEGGFQMKRETPLYALTFEVGRASAGVYKGQHGGAGADSEILTSNVAYRSAISEIYSRKTADGEQWEKFQGPDCIFFTL